MLLPICLLVTHSTFEKEVYHAAARHEVVHVFCFCLVTLVSSWVSPYRLMTTPKMGLKLHILRCFLGFYRVASSVQVATNGAKLLPPKSNLEAENPHESQRNTKSRCIESIEQIIALMWRLRAIAAISWITAPVAGNLWDWIAAPEMEPQLKLQVMWLVQSQGSQSKLNTKIRVKGPAYVLRKHLFSHLGQALLETSNFQCHCYMAPFMVPKQFSPTLGPQKSHRKNEGWKIPMKYGL